MDTYREARYICRLLTEGGFPTMMAGGCVRDQLFNLTPNDYDLATTAHPKEMIRFFRKRGMRTVPVGINHGTIALITDLQQIEITTLRADEACDGRHAEVRFSDSFEEDAQRRDFTINALFKDADEKIHDFVGGQADLKAQKLRFVGDPGSRIREDYLRILRFFRFLGRLGWSEETDQMEAVTANLDGLARLSAERIYKELNLTLATKHVDRALDALARSGTLQVLFPKIQLEHLSKTSDMIKRLENPVLRWFSLIHWNQAATERKHLRELVDGLRFSRRDRRCVLGLFDLFQTLDQTYDPFLTIMNLILDDLFQTEEISNYLTLINEVFAIDVHEDVYDLLKGLGERDKPSIDKEYLLQIEARERGRAVELVKIYWYSGRCRDKNQVNQILSRPEYYKEQWVAGTRDPLPRGGD